MMQHAVRQLPRDDRTNGWSAVLPPRKPQAALSGEQEFDWVVVGAGYAGLAAARRLATLEPNASVAIVEAGEVGENASGRNSGFAIDLPHSSSETPGAVAQARRSIQVGRFALNELDGLIKQYAIACGWERRGRYHAAVTEEIGGKILQHYAAHLKSWGEEYQWFERKELQERLGTAYYNSAIFTPGTYLLNPAALVRGLADTLPQNVSLFENSAVTEFDFQGPSRYVRTANGRIRFRKLILAVNAFSPSFGVYKDRQIPVLLFASLTKPLTSAQRERLGSEPSWGVTPAHGVVGSTVRLTDDGRLLIRQGFEYSPSLQSTEERRAQAKREHIELLSRRFPQLDDVDIEHFWMGWLAVSRNSAPAFGRVHENVYAASCCNGSGIVRHTAAGLLISDLALGRKNDLIDDFLAYGTASYLPPRPLRDLGIRAKLYWDIRSGRAEE